VYLILKTNNINRVWKYNY